MCKNNDQQNKDSIHLQTSRNDGKSQFQKLGIGEVGNKKIRQCLNFIEVAIEMLTVLF